MMKTKKYYNLASYTEYLPASNNMKSVDAILTYDDERQEIKVEYTYSRDYNYDEDLDEIGYYDKVMEVGYIHVDTYINRHGVSYAAFCKNDDDKLENLFATLDLDLCNIDYYDIVDLNVFLNDVDYDF